MKKAFAIIGIILAGVTAFFIVKFIATPNAINVVNFFHDDIIRFINDNQESYHALIDYPFHQHIITHGGVFEPNIKKESAYFTTKTTNKTEEGFIYLYDDNHAISIPWARFNLSDTLKSGNDYTIEFDAITIKLSPIKGNFYYYHVTWHTQRPTSDGG